MSQSPLPVPVVDPAGERYRIEYDPALRIIRIRETGFWTAQDAKEFVVHTEKFMAAVRRIDGALRLLVDRRNTPVQSAEVMRIIASQQSRREEGDRAALIIDTALGRMQVERAMEPGNARVFTNAEEAEAWLVGD